MNFLLLVLETNSPVMRPRRSLSLLCKADLCVSAGVWMLPAPSSVHMESVNMRHILRWRPPQAAGHTAVLYSVQFQGEFELTVLNGSWVDAPECQLTPHAHCDLTFDLGSDADYNIRVRAQRGSRLSNWTQLSRPFNRRHSKTTSQKFGHTGARIAQLVEPVPMYGGLLLGAAGLGSTPTCTPLLSFPLSLPFHVFSCPVKIKVENAQKII
uniref:Fibronectin type-III domain-containing protein n=1 Tax=Sander lucioperca TaxID=283035 RepID=A0A8C9ZNY1_SANLU